MVGRKFDLRPHGAVLAKARTPRVFWAILGSRKKVNEVLCSSFQIGFPSFDQAKRVGIVGIGEARLKLSDGAQSSQQRREMNSMKVDFESTIARLQYENPDLQISGTKKRRKKLRRKV